MPQESTAKNTTASIQTNRRKHSQKQCAINENNTTSDGME